jgi:DNA-directed RNA polymerase specialized sigma24 family protein
MYPRWHRRQRCHAGVATSLIAVVQDGAASAGSQLAAEVEEASLIAALRVGDEGAFRDLVKRYHASLVRLARASVASQAVAEEVAQDTWLAVIKGISGFEGRSSLKTWIFRILVNQARKRGAREHRIIPVSSLGAEGSDGDAGKGAQTPSDRASVSTSQRA